MILYIITGLIIYIININYHIKSKNDKIIELSAIIAYNNNEKKDIIELNNIITIKDTYILELDNINQELNKLIIDSSKSRYLFAKLEVKRMNIKKTYDFNIKNYNNINYLTKINRLTDIINNYENIIKELKETRGIQRNKIIELKEIIENLKIYYNNNNVSVVSCSICLEDININDANIVITKCNHYFHKTCLAKWQNNTCPNCRNFL